MADAIVSIVLRNLSDAAVKEVLQQRGVAEQVETVCAELSLIHSFLGDAETKQMGDNRWRNWVEEVRDVSYDLEDAVDIYLSEVPPKESDELECKIDQILARLQEISNSMVQYGIDNFGGKSTCEEGVGQLSSIRPAVASEIGNPDVVLGFDADKEYILERLEGTGKLSVVAIVGPAGIGKTTLASQIYNSVEVHRAYGTACVWVTIPQAFSLQKVYLNILEKLESTSACWADGYAEDEDTLVDFINHILKGKKFFLVLDNVQTADLWIAIQRALPDDHNGSRVLMTTTNLAIAEHADTTGQPHKLHFLTEDISLQLLLRKALPIHQDPIKECPKNLSNHAKQFVKQCGGLPLALVVLGGILSKTSEYAEWGKLLQMINWHANVENQCIEIIATSYEHLPAVLKPCFMYFAAFPEDFEIRAKPLIRMWVAEGFIPQRENKTLEETATSFLEDFIERNMVKVSERAYDNSIKRCHIHSVLRDLAVQKARENKFLAVCTNPDDIEQQNFHEARRLAVHCAWQKSDEIMKKASINLRSLFLFNSVQPNCSQLKVLKVLSHLEPKKFPVGDDLEIQRIEGCTQLRYLELPYFMQYDFESNYFNKLISSMKFLQTLDLPDARASNQINDIWHIKTLRHVMIRGPKFYDDFVLAPPNWAELTNLQTLRGVKYGLYYPETPESPNMPNLHDLRIEYDFSFDSEKSVEYLGTLKHLVSLQMLGRTAPAEMFDIVSRFPFFQNLKSLILCNGFGADVLFLSVAMFPTNLTKVKLVNFELSNDPMAELEKLPVLKILKFEGPGFWNHVMRCSAGGFPKLEKLKLLMDCAHEWEWKIENGAMPMLQKLEICHFDGLCVPLGLQYLSSLRWLDWTQYEYQDNSPNKAKLIRELCKHVPYVSLINFEKKME